MIDLKLALIHLLMEPESRNCCQPGCKRTESNESLLGAVKNPVNYHSFSQIIMKRWVFKRLILPQITEKKITGLCILTHGPELLLRNKFLGSWLY